MPTNKTSSSDHSTSSRTEELIDGNIGAWWTEDDTEWYLGAFKDQRHAEFEIANAIETAEARWADEPAPEPKATAKKTDTKDTKES